MRKEYARKTEFLDQVWDGSAGEVHAAYWLCSVIGTEIYGSELTPLYQQLFSVRVEEFVSENEEILSAIDRLRAHTHGRRIWEIDRGGNRQKRLAPLLERPERLVIRSTGQRMVLDRRHDRVTTHHLGACCRLRHQAKTIQIENSQEKIHELRYGAEPIRLPGREEPLQLVVVASFGQEPLLLLTDLFGVQDSQSLWWIVPICLTRWRTEETSRFVKQSYHPENHSGSVLPAAEQPGFTDDCGGLLRGYVLGAKLKVKILCKKLLIISQLFFDIPPFRFYALADGIRNILSRGNPSPPADPPKRLQLELLLDRETSRMRNVSSSKPLTNKGSPIYPLTRSLACGHTRANTLRMLQTPIESLMKPHAVVRIDTAK